MRWKFILYLVENCLYICVQRNVADPFPFDLHSCQKGIRICYESIVRFITEKSATSGGPVSSNIEKYCRFNIYINSQQIKFTSYSIDLHDLSSWWRVSNVFHVLAKWIYSLAIHGYEIAGRQPNLQILLYMSPAVKWLSIRLQFLSFILAAQQL